MYFFDLGLLLKKSLDIGGKVAECPLARRIEEETVIGPEGYAGRHCDRVGSVLLVVKMMSSVRQHSETITRSMRQGKARDIKPYSEGKESM